MTYRNYSPGVLAIRFVLGTLSVAIIVAFIIYLIWGQEVQS